MRGLGHFQDQNWRSCLSAIGAILILLGSIVAIAVLVGMYLKYMADELWGFLGLDSEHLSIASKLSALWGMFLIAETLHRFKRGSQKWYGVVECGFALGFAWRVLSSQLVTDRYQNAIVLLAATYLLSRGIANYVDGGGRILLSWPVDRLFDQRAERK